jgi:signal transduction histidine kinase
MGLLVTARADRDWNEQEQGMIGSIAKTLAIACLLDQRRAWLEQQMEQQKLLQLEQRDLLDNLLHQLRNPLTAIRTFGKLLLKRLRPTDPNGSVATSIIRESIRLQELLQQLDRATDFNDVANNSALVELPKEWGFVPSSGEKEVKPLLLLPGGGEQTTICLLTDILAPLLLSFQNIASEQNQELITEIPANLPLVRANEPALREVLINIIDNALKYTPAGGKIIIQLGRQKANFQGIGISDTGPGIPLQDLPHLGERHYRGIQAQTEIPGTGLGIAIAKQLIKQMQGEIEVFSPAIDSTITSPQTPGTTFIIWLREEKGMKK